MKRNGTESSRNQNRPTASNCKILNASMNVTIMNKEISEITRRCMLVLVGTVWKF